MLTHLKASGLFLTLSASETWMGFLVGALPGAAVVIRPFSGMWMERIGRRPIIVLSSVVQTLSCALYLLIDAPDGFAFGVRVVHGFASGALYSSLFTAVTDVLPVHKRTQGIALYGVSGIIPMALGGALGDALVPSGIGTTLADYHTLFLVALATSGTATLISIWIRETRVSRVVGEGAAPSFALIGDSRFVPIWAAGLGFSLSLGASYAFVEVLGRHGGLNLVGRFFSAYAISAVCLRIAFGWVPERFGLYRVLVPSMLAVSLHSLSLVIYPGALGAIVAGAFAGIGHGFSFPILSSLTAQKSAPSETSTSLALFAATFDLGLMIAGPLAGVLVEHWNIHAMFACMAVPPVIGLLVMFRLGRPPTPKDAAGH